MGFCLYFVCLFCGLGGFCVCLVGLVLLLVLFLF